MAGRYRICEYPLKKKWENYVTLLTQESASLGMRVSRKDPEVLAKPQRESVAKPEWI